MCMGIGIGIDLRQDITYQTSIPLLIAYIHRDLLVTSYLRN